METLFDINIETTRTYVRSKKKKQSDFKKLVRDLYQNTTNKKLEMDGTLSSLYAYYFSRMSTRKNCYKRKMFKRLLLHLYNENCFQIIKAEEQVAILFKMSQYGDRFVRNVEGWKREGLNETQQLNSLLKHCFELYPTATFLRDTFFKTNNTHITWYVDIALGKSVFELTAFPSMFTKKMAHAFTNISEKCSVEKALSIAVVKSCKPSPTVQYLIINSSLVAQNLTEDAFWRSAVQFFCGYHFLERHEFYEVLDYLAYVKNRDTDFTLKGRTFASLKRLSDEWHERAYLRRDGNRNLFWNSQGVQPFEYVEIENDTIRAYKIEELCSSKELFTEGFKMRHCVAGYDLSCSMGRSAIFTLYEYEDENTVVEKLVTIEINLTDKKIMQARGKCNQKPSRKCIAIIQEWAKEVDYSIYKYAF